MRKNLLCFSPYCAPDVRIVQLCIERGFQASLENPVTDPEINW